ncbi:MAG: hypothetical protein HYW52_07710 [Gemmatimonadetes bacterium]|nr:hypothetical protein [Gemmatimonadota bacterium]
MPPDFLFWNEVIIPLAVLAAGVILGLPVVRAVVRHVERKGGAPGETELAALRASMEELRSRLDRAEDFSGRLAEMEERLDFAERLLTQQRERAVLRPGAAGQE